MTHLRYGMIAGLMTLSSAFALTPAASAASGEEGAVEVVNDAVGQTMTALEDQTISQSEASGIIKLVKVDRVAQFALGKTWKTVSDDQKGRYIDAFHTYANAQLQQHLSNLSVADAEVTDVTTRGEGDAIVTTKVATEDNPNESVSWRVIDEGGWGIVDIQVQDVWFAIQQREQFQAVLDQNNGDIDALIEKLSAGSL
ncbi:ABC transporter substrate-binding protein [Henriciella sp.]|uniref:MlaC/ttg2D family ABC transporter substrate-binding protein n=1 Tax=Henriciella sp. TaxID=1968823 RepID=UPI002626806C|nr:ABC transporter substrate-binding protein [Henriciella sp.]